MIKETYKPNYYELNLFWDWLVKGYPKDAYTEIRLMSIKDDDVYDEVKRFSINNPNIIMKKNSQFFIKNFTELQTILKYNNYYFIYNSKVCYSLNPRFLVDDNIGGSYEFLKIQNKIYLDIEKKDHSPLYNNQDLLIKKYADNIIQYLFRYNLEYPTIIKSGNGIHIIYRTEIKKIDEGRREGYKKLINEIIEKTNSELFHVDSVVDLTRTTALPETLNPKNGYKVRWIELGELTNDFYVKKTQLRKKKTQTILTKNNVRGSLAWKILTNNPPIGNLNNTLLFYIKMLIRDNEENYREYEPEINRGYSSKWSLNPNTGVKGKICEFGIVVNWCKTNEEWCKENNISFKDYKY